MSERDYENEQIAARLDVVSALLQAMKRGLRTFWWLIIILVLAGGGILGYRSWRSYSPSYTAYATFTVRVKNNYYASISSYNAHSATQMEKTFPYILTSGILYDRVKEDLGISYLPSISAKATSGSNMITLYVKGSDPKFCHDVLESVIKNYPELAEYVVGATYLVMIDESGVPQEPTNTRDWKPSAKKGALYGLIAGLAVAFIYGLAKATVSTREEVESISNARYIGAIPKTAV
ncbi:MAG: hypothetical protein II534_05050, partial [Clostridia bacterium]|nr:hypothetical protein [Clostridia bacterium]